MNLSEGGIFIGITDNVNGLKVVSLYDGISCGRAALERAGYAVFSYHAYEIDKYARSINRYQYPETVHHGDVLDADFNVFVDKGIDLVIGGSPCTYWSISRAGAGREVDKSGMGWKLFMRFVEAVRQIKPRYFLLENVASMPQSIKAYITEELGVEPVLINSALVSAQSRKRLYWTNITGISQPEDKGILLKDILETGLCVRDKSYCIDASYYKGGIHGSPHRQSTKRLMVYEPVPIALADKSQTILSTLHKENALSMVKRNKTGLFVAHAVDDAKEIGAALRTREDENGRFKRLEVRNDGKLNALTTVQTDSVICSPVRLGIIGKGGQGERIYSVKGKSVSIKSGGGGRGANTGLYKIDLPDGDYTIRKLSTIEAERCQTLPDNFTAWGVNDKGDVVKISNTQRYRAIGNGFTVDVIAHILSHMK
jgi:DNA (cytosine-5)-methyltransferase 3A